MLSRRQELVAAGLCPAGTGRSPVPTRSRFPDVRAVLEVVLENLRG
jgi:hypothetical protein